MEHVERQIFKRSEQSQVLRLNAMNERSTSLADRAITDANMIQIDLDFEPYSPAVAGALICLHHKLSILVSK